jgi:hypothetical protein
MQGGVESIYLVYYRYDDDVSARHPRWWINYLTGKITKSPYIHVEIVFDNGDVYGVQMGSPISKVFDKSYRQNKYTCQEIPVYWHQAQAMRSFLEGCLRKPSSFNYWGFWLLPFWPSSGAKKNKWFCSELVASALSAGGIYFVDRPPHTISPGDLFKLVKETHLGFIRPMLHSENKPLIV